MIRTLLLLNTVLFFCALNATAQQVEIKAGGPTTFCNGDSVLLTVTGAAQGSTFRWRKDVTLIAGATTSSYWIFEAGSYDVVVTRAGVHDTLPAVKITVNANPVAGFNNSAANQCSNLPISFTNTSTGTGLTYAWTFGDPNSNTSNQSTVRNPSHIFVGTPGNGNQNFNVKMTVTDNKGCSASISKVVTTKQVPGTQLGGTGAITYNDLPYFTQCNSVASTFTFTNQSSTRANNTNYRIKWGDGSPDFTANDFTSLTHTYNVGTHKLQFIVTGDNGCTDTADYHVFVGSNPAVGLGNPGNTVICTGTSLTFPIGNTESNPPGTVYIASFNDGSLPINFNHPAPPSVTHRFDESSCGMNGNEYSNSFLARIVASNPCGISSATVAPIYVSQKASADFEISPNDTTCVNTLVTLTNSGISGNSISALGVCTPGKSIWRITPATGWTISNGSLGDDFNLDDPSAWMSGTTQLQIRFTQPGVYKVKLRSGASNLCGDDEIEKTICVNPIPVANFTTDVNEGCAPLTVKTTNTSNSPLCGTNTYSWSVEYANNSGCPGTSDYSFVNNTTAASANPQFQFKTPGYYTIKLVTSNKDAGCASVVFSKQILVKAKPVVTVNAPTTICQQQTIRPAATVQNCFATTTPTYEWLFAGGLPGSSTSADPGEIIYNTPGTHTITLKVKNECGTTTITKQITVNPTPALTVPDNKILCAGEASGALNFTQVSPGAAVTWTNSNTSIGLPASGSGNINSFTATNNTGIPVIARIDARATLNGCQSPVQTFTITVHPKPAALSVNSPVNYCVGEMATPLSATSAPGHHLLWYTGNTSTPGSPTAPIPSTTTAGETTYYVSQVNTTSGCESIAALIKVIVKPTPVISHASPFNPTTCGSATGSINLQGFTANTTYTVKYTRNGVPVSKTIVSNASGEIDITGLNAGTYDNIRVERNGCASNEVGPFVLNDPDPPAAPMAESNSPICSGETLQLNASTSSSGTITYSWSGPNQFSSTQKNPVLSGATTAASGDYTVSITRNGCSVTKTISVLIHPKPARPVVSRPVTYCLDATASPLTATADNAHTLNWYDNPQLNNGSQQPPTPITNNAGTKNYYLTQENSFGCKSDTVIIPVIIYPKLSGNQVGSNQTICSGQTSQELSSITDPVGGDGQYIYQWQISTDNGNTWTNIPQANSKNYSAGSVQVSSKYRRTVQSGGCDLHISNEVTITIQGNLANFEITADQSICAGQIPQLLKGQQPTGGSGTYDYQWEQSDDQNNWTVIANSNSIDYQPPPLTTTRYFRRKVTSGSCSVYSSAIRILANQIPVMNNLPDLVYCAGSSTNTIQFTSSASTGMMYQWSSDLTAIGIPNSGTGNLPSFTTTNDQKTPLTASISVVPILVDGNTQCAGDPKSFKITVLPLIRLQPVDDVIVCTGSTVPAYEPKHDAQAFPGAKVSYSWTVSGTGTALTSSSGSKVPEFLTTNNGNQDLLTTIQITPRYEFGNIICEGEPVTYTVTVKSGVGNNAVSADQDICINTSAAILEGTIPAGGDGGYQYQWQNSVDGGVTWADIPGARAADYDPGILSITTMFRRNVTTQLCSGPGSSSSDPVTIRIIDNARARFIAAKDTGCAPFVIDATLVQTQTFPQNGLYKWYANGQLIGTGVDFPGYTINNSRDSVTIKLVVESGHGCKPDSIEKRFYTYHQPTPAFTVSTSEGCGPLQVEIRNTTPDAGLFSYEWDFGNGQTSNAEQPGIISFLPNPNFGDTIYTVRMTTHSVCSKTVLTKDILVKSKPKALFAPDITVGCSPMTVRFNNTSAGNQNQYTWDFGDGSPLVTSNDRSPVSHVFMTATRDTFHVKLLVENECGADSMSYAIVVSPNTIKLDFAVNGNEESGCAPHPTRFINNSQGASGFTWDFGDGRILNTQKNIDTVSHIFMSPGIYNVTLYATNGCSDTSSVERITVYPTPVATFEIVSACPGDSVRFRNLTQTATSFHWDFGDGQTSNLKDPSHLYASPGNYSVVLTSYQFNAPGSICQDTISHAVDLGPSGQFTYSTTTSCNDNNVTFQVQTTNADTLLFEFGDGEILKTTDNVVTHAYKRGGLFTPRVTLINSSGCSITLTGSQPVRADKLDAGFHTIYDLQCGNTTVEFRDTSHVFFGIRSVHWDFGDGTNGTGSIVRHTYNSSGTYNVRMIVESNSGCTDTTETPVNVIVHSIPVANINAEALSCTGYSISFAADIASQDAVTMTQWTFSNGAQYTGNEIQHSFSQAGLYSVQLITGTEFGCYDTADHEIRIQPSPAVSAGPDQTICLGNSTRLQATGNQLVEWMPMEGLSCTDCPNPVAAPRVTTPYIVRATNAFGCNAYDSVVVQVIQPLRLVVSGNDSICLGTSTTLIASGAQTYQWTPATGLSDTHVSNPVAAPTTTTRYQVVGYDGFNCFTDTAYVTVATGEHPTISLGPDLVLSTGTLHPLATVVENGPVRKWNWTPSTDLSCDDCPLPIAEIKKDITYKVRITTPYGCEASDTIQIKVFCENTQLFIANAFTPDGDGINDVLFVQGKGIARVKSWRIFNRWGETVFERSNFAPNDPSYGWDGRVRGVAGGPDVFVYTAEVICENGTSYQYKGNVSIIK